MITTFTSKAKSAKARGEEFGARFAAQIAQNIDIYRRLFLLSGTRSLAEIQSAAQQAFSVVRSFAPSIADEIQGLAEGARVSVSDVMSLNARTELLAASRMFGQSECSVVISLGNEEPTSAPVAVQSWDWLSELADGWLLWSIEGEDGHVIHTLTEYGIVGKIGVNSAGVGVMLNILSHERDGQLPIGLPVHIAARSILEERVSLNGAIARIAAAPMTASSSLSVVAKSGDAATAFSLEMFPGGPAFCIPDEFGLLVHTNHFLSVAGTPGDRAAKSGSSSFSRYEQLRRRLHRKESVKAGDVLSAMSSHVGGSHTICSHSVAGAPFGEKSETMAVVQLDVSSGEIQAHRGGACSIAPWTTSRAEKR